MATRKSSSDDSAPKAIGTRSRPSSGRAKRVSDVVAAPDAPVISPLKQETNTEAIDFAWDGQDRYREPMPTLLDPDPLRHDEEVEGAVTPPSDQPRSQVETLPDHDPLRHDLPEGEAEESQPQKSRTRPKT